MKDLTEMMALRNYELSPEPDLSYTHKHCNTCGELVPIQREVCPECFHQSFCDPGNIVMADGGHLTHADIRFWK